MPLRRSSVRSAIHVAAPAKATDSATPVRSNAAIVDPGIPAPPWINSGSDTPATKEAESGIASPRYRPANNCRRRTGCASRISTNSRDAWMCTIPKTSETSGISINSTFSRLSMTCGPVPPNQNRPSATTKNDAV
jgi:hypothetical protein